MLLHGVNMASTHHTHHKEVKRQLYLFCFAGFFNLKRKTDSLSLGFGIRVGKGTNTARFIVKRKKNLIYFAICSPSHFTYILNFQI